MDHTSPISNHDPGNSGLRCGITTGTCAAAAARAAACMLRTGEEIQTVQVELPDGGIRELAIEDIRWGYPRNGSTAPNAVSCAVRKDSGDDPDVTDGMRIYARVSKTKEPGIRITGGEGIGTVTRPGLDQPVGEYAINSGPRRMIRDNVLAAMPDSGLRVEISIPGGTEIAAKTFNSRLGIVGGLSVLGTTGILKPMSEDAIRETIRAEISVRAAERHPVLLLAPGNIGLSYYEEVLGIPSGLPVLSSNYIRETCEMAADAGFRKLVLAGHLGKMIKVAGGIGNTHSRYGDHRMEILAKLADEQMEETGHYNAQECEDRCCTIYDRKVLEEKILQAVTTDAAMDILHADGLADAVLIRAAEKAREVMEAWLLTWAEKQRREKIDALGSFSSGVIIFAGKNREYTTASKGTEALIEEIRQWYILSERGRAQRI